MTTTNDGSGTVSKWDSPEFRQKCEAAGVKHTRRQFSKYRNGYGALRLAEGTSKRIAPPGHRRIHGTIITR